VLETAASNQLETSGGAAWPELFLGTERLGSVLPSGLGPTNGAETFRMLDELVWAGCKGLDLAASYQLGGTERLIGEWLSSRRNRGELFLVSKGGHPYPVVRPNRLGSADISSDLHDSLRRLRTERIDLYLLHRDHPAAALDQLVITLGAHQSEGKIGAWGLSNWHHDRILEIQRVAQALGLPGPAASSPQFSLAEWSTPPWKGCVSISGSAQKQARKFHERSQLPVLAYSALGRGFFAEQPRATLQPTYLNAANEAKKKRVAELAARLGKSPAQVAIAYLCRQPFPVHPIIAVSSAAHYRQNLEATRLALSPDEMRWLELG
jgi:aryl-alcohol dehydrogenase-like predicted oxidoreductase